MADADILPDSIGRHFQVQSLIGSGGTSRVLHVLDQRSDQHLALKQALVPASERRARSHALFRQEFHVLSRVVHPNVVRAYEYGFADDRPFYTMELLRGRALSELAPLAWQRLCSVLLDLCSPLSMLHARRFVHCDVTARNVLVTEQGVTKLIDFGALTATDRPVTIIAGTPPHMAPELVHRQSIDGRVDMFAIGALAYSMLTGQHAYPARTIQELPHVWTAMPPSVRARGFAIPAALDELIMSLLSLEANARPLQLAELVHRLSAIIDSAYALDTASLQAQLATPDLVGRAPALENFRTRLWAAHSGEGAVLCFAGKKGTGRSRMLETCALEAIHASCLVIHVSSDQAPNVPFGLVAQVFAAAHAQDATLESQLPDAIRTALESSGDPGLALARALAAQPEAALRECWRALCAARTAVVLLDDLTRADVSSLRHCLGLDYGALPVLVVAAIDSDSPLARAVSEIVSAERIIALTLLDRAEVAQLLRSVFGEAAQLEALIEWVQRAADGVPGACVELSHYAVEQGYVRFVDGQFRISDEISSGRAALPEAFDATITRAIAGLSQRAREALGALALVTVFGPLTAAEQTALLRSAGWSQTEVLDALDELRDGQLIVLGWGGYELHYQSVEGHATAQLSAQATRDWHLRIAALYEQRGHDARMLVVLHYDYAGDTTRAYRELLALDALLRGPDDPNIKLGGSELGIALHQRMLRHGLASGAPRLELMHYRRVLLRIGATADARLISEAPALLEQLRDDAGLSYWDSTDEALPELDRVHMCMARAQERFMASQADERLAPRDAIKQLAESVATTMAICDAAFDAAPALELAAQLRPLRVLSAGLELHARQIEATSQLLTCGGLMIERWRSQLQAFQTRPEELPELIWKYRLAGLHYHLGRELAQLGDPAALQHAEVLSLQQRTAPQACSVRLLYALAYGDHVTAAKQRRQRAIAALASRHEDQRLAASYVAEIELLDACGDLLELQQTAAWFEVKGSQFAGFRPFASYARALCLLQCGQVAEAQQLVELQVHEVPALKHAAWALLRALRAELALISGEPLLAKELASDVLQTAAAAGIDGRVHTRPRRVLALACAALGEISEAHAALEPWRKAFQSEAAVRTVHAGQLHETYARIALAEGDRELCAAHCERAHAVYTATGNPGLMARLQKLTTSDGFTQDARDGMSTSSERLSSVQTDLAGLDRNEQLDYLLALLVQDADVDAGHLYWVSANGQVQCVATHHTLINDSALDAQVAAYIGRLTSSLDDVTLSVMALEDDSLLRPTPTGEPERFAALCLRGSDAQIHGVALLRVQSPHSLRLQTEGLSVVVADVLAQAHAAG